MTDWNALSDLTARAGQHRRTTDPQNGDRWYQIRNAADDSAARVMIYGAIGESFWGDSVPASEFVREVAALDVDRIELHINSPGGSIFDGVAITNCLRQHKAQVVGYVDGLAASAASFIAVGGCDELIMGRNTQLMIHDGSGVCVGNAADMQEMADLLDKLSANIADIYTDKAGGEPGEWRAAMLAETWYSADEAVAAGLADQVDTGETAKDPENLFDLTPFNYAGRSKAPTPPFNCAVSGTPTPPAEPAEPTQPNEGNTMPKLTDGLRQRLGITDAELDDDGLLAALDEALSEQTTPPAAASPAAPPEGTLIVDAEQYATLQADAQAGREARDRQIADERAALVNAAVTDGRIPPSRADHWNQLLTADPGAAETLAQLPKNTLNLTPAGYTGGVDEASGKDELYAKAWGDDTDKKGA